MNDPARRSLRIALLSLAFAAGTVVFGWWSVPVIALAWGLVGRGSWRPALTAGLSASVGWVVLLGWSAVNGPVAILAQKLGGVAQVPGGVFLGLTVLLPFALGFTAARALRN